MRRLPNILLAAFLGGVTACVAQRATPTGGGGGGEAEPVRRGGPITVNVSCKDTGQGIGVTVRPWHARSARSTTRAMWRLVPANKTMPTELSPVDSSRWPFDRLSYSWSQDSMFAQLKTEADTGQYRYRLRVICLTDTTADTIVIDPIYDVQH